MRARVNCKSACNEPKRANYEGAHLIELQRSLDLRIINLFIRHPCAKEADRGRKKKCGAAPLVLNVPSLPSPSAHDKMKDAPYTVYVQPVPHNLRRHRNASYRSFFALAPARPPLQLFVVFPFVRIGDWSRICDNKKDELNRGS